MYNYFNDQYAKICLDLARQCKTYMGFGAVLVKNGIVIGSGRNKLSTIEERSTLSHVDYAIHAEQSAIYNAIQCGHDINGTTVYVLGLALSGKNKGTLTTRTNIEFICHKCPHTLIKYNVSVCIPHIDGWKKMSPQEAMKTGLYYKGSGHWNKFAYE